EADGREMCSFVKVWDVQSGQQVSRLKGLPGYSMGSIAVTANGKTLAWAGGDGTIRVKDVDTGKELHRFRELQRGTVTPTLVFTPDGKTLAVKRGRSLQLWDLETEKEKRLQEDERVLAQQPTEFDQEPFGTTVDMAVSTDGKTLALADGNLIRLVNLGTG